MALRAEGAAAGQQLWVDSSRARGCGEGQLGWMGLSEGVDGGGGGGPGRCCGSGVWCADALSCCQCTAVGWHVNCEVKQARAKVR